MVNAGSATGDIKAPVVCDFTSDTITKPTPEMRQAMLEAVVGDEQYGADPTTNRLEKLGAELLVSQQHLWNTQTLLLIQMHARIVTSSNSCSLSSQGKEDAVLVCSGIMGNLIAVMVHCPDRGSQIFVGDQSHHYGWEQGNASALAGVHQRVVRNLPDGSLDLEQLQEQILKGEAAKDFHFPRQRLVVVENTHNRMGGQALGVEYMDSLAALAHRHGMALHVDGARLFNAATKLGVSASRLVRNADSVSVCLSKGLCAPIGAILAGSKEFIREARHFKKALGGALRQSGVIAAPGIIALTKMVDRLHEDQENADFLRAGLASVPGIVLDPALSQNATNMVVASVDPKVLSVSATNLARLWKDEGVVVSQWNEHVIRFVLHRDISRSQLQEGIRRIEAVCRRHMIQPSSKM